MTLRRALRAAWTGGLLALALAGSARAETLADPFETRGEGLAAGHFVLYPAVSFEYTYDSNILFMSNELPGSDPIASGVVVVQPRILVYLPLSDGRVRFVYAPFYRNYTNPVFKPEDRLNHAFDFEGLFRRSRTFTFAVRDHYLDGIASLQEVGDRNGLSTGLGQYSIHNPQLEFGVHVGERHGFLLMPSYSSSSYTGTVTSLGQVGDYSYTSRRLEGRYNYLVTPPSTIYGYAAAEETLQTQTGVEDITIHDHSIGLGYTRAVHENVSTLVSAGYQTLTFDGGIGRDYSGPIVEANAQWQVAGVTRIDGGFLYRAYPSVFADSNYYIATGVRAHVTHQIGRDSYWEGGGSVQDNLYVPLAGEGRRERMYRLELGLGHEFRKGVRGFVGYNFDRRQSNVLLITPDGGVDPYGYYEHRIMFRLEVGWL